MTTTVELDKSGQLVLPRRMRNALRLVPGSRVVIEQTGNAIIIQPETKPGYCAPYLHLRCSNFRRIAPDLASTIQEPSAIPQNNHGDSHPPVVKCPIRIC